MKKPLAIILLFTITYCSAFSQTILYKQTFDSSYADWSLNDTNLGSDNSLTTNAWIVDTNYTGGACSIAPSVIIGNTPYEPSGISGYPASKYLHIYSPVCGVLDCNYDAAGSSTYFSKMNVPVNTSSDTGVKLSFWWLCNGGGRAAGYVYYSVDSGNTWVQIMSPFSYLNLDTVWSKDSVELDTFSHEQHLQFAFVFQEALTGNDPAFAVDDIMITGTHVSTAVPIIEKNTSFWLSQSGNDTRITASETITTNLQVEITDAIGRLLLRDVWLQGANSFSMNTDRLAPGMYFIKIYGANTATVLKWLKK